MLQSRNRLTQGWLQMTLAVITIMLSACAVCAHASPKNNSVTYSCASSAKGTVILSSTTTFTPTQAGFDIKPPPVVSGTAGNESCTSDHAFFFSVPEPEGNYRVTVSSRSDIH